MDVQKTNFAEAVGAFNDSIGQCELVALDLEFTGVRGRPEGFIDSIEERYSGLRRVASTFKIIQVGLSCFIRKEGFWEAHPYNFYVFPSEVPGHNQRLILEVGAINFLKEHHMDFNTWFYNGIPYLNEAQSKELESKLIEVSEDTNEVLVLNKTYDQVKMNEVVFRIDAWLESAEETLEVLGLNAYLRRYLYSYVKKKYNGVFMESVKVEGSRDVAICLKKAGAEKLKELEAKRMSEKSEQYLEKIGFQRVFAMLTGSKKPLIVHNGMLDILFMLASFQDELPEKYSDFKELVSRLFPYIYDTRFLLEKIPGLYEEFDKIAPAKGLKELYNFLKGNSQNQVTLGRPFEKYYDEKYAHEAGFDAFMTGICFLKLTGIHNDLQTYKNHLPLYKCFYSIRLDGEDILWGDNHYYIKGADVKHHFSGNEGFQFKYVKEDECFVKPNSEERLQELQNICASKKLVFSTVEAYFASKKQNINKNS